MEIVKRCGAVDAPVVEELLKERKNTDDVSRFYGYFIGVTERWTDQNLYVMDMSVNPRKAPEPFQKVLRRIDRLTPHWCEPLAQVWRA